MALDESTDGSSLRAEILTAARSRLGREWNRTGKCDPFSRLYFIESGAGTVHHHERRFDLRPGHLYLIPAGTCVDLRCPQRVVIRWLHFNLILWGGLSAWECWPCRYEAAPPSPRSISMDLERLRAIHASTHPRHLMESRERLFRLLAFFLEGPPQSPPFPPDGVLRFRPVLDHIHARLSSPLRLAELAAIAHLEPAYFCSLFTRCLGVSPRQYILRKRMEAARLLLLRDSRKLEDIAAELGFTDAFHLSKIFKKITGESPQQFRSQKGAPLP